MAYSLVITPRASIDVADAIFYYESIQMGLGYRLLSVLVKTYDKLKENPQHYSLISAIKKSKLRDVSIKGFPYNIIFEIDENTITVYAVFNTHRKPKYK